MRCCDPKCSLRPAGDISAGPLAHSPDEIPEDDLEAPDCDANMEPEAESDEDMPGATAGDGIAKKERFVNCFPFAYPVSYYDRVLPLGQRHQELFPAGSGGRLGGDETHGEEVGGNERPARA